MRRAQVGVRSIEGEAKRLATLLPTSTAVTHNILSGTHVDSATVAVTRGAIIYGDSTPEWNLLTVGSDGEYLRADGTDFAWAAIQAGDLPSHTHSHDTDLTGVSANDHHNQIHVLATNAGLGSDHTISGAAAGYVLRASSATAAAFAQLQHDDLGGVGVNDHHNQSHVLANTAGLGSDHTTSGLSAGQVLRATGATTAAFQNIQDGDLPATIVRTSRTLTAGDGLTGLGDLSADRTVDLGTPGTCDATTSNGVTASSHTHAITTSSNPGAAAAILASDASGYLQLERVGLGISPTQAIHAYHATAAVNVLVQAAANEAHLLLRGDTATNCAYIEFQDLGSGHGWYLVARGTDHASATDDFLVQRYDGSWVSWLEFDASATAVLFPTGNVGIADTSPTEGRLVVVNSAADNGAIGYFYRDQGTVNDAGVYIFLDNASDDEAAVKVRHDGTGAQVECYDGASLTFSIMNAGGLQWPALGNNPIRATHDTTGEGFIVYEDVSGWKGLFNAYWNSGNPLTFLLDPNTLATTTHISCNSSLTLATGGTDDITIDSGGYVILAGVSKGTTGDPVGSEGMFYYNTVDNVAKWYCDGGWRTIASW